MEQSDPCPAEQAESQEESCSTLMEGGVSAPTPPVKQAQDLKVQFVLEQEAEEEQLLSVPCITPPESGLPAGWLMSPEETSGSGGTAFTIWGPCYTPPPPKAPPPLFTPYKPDAIVLSCDETTSDHGTGAWDQHRDSRQEEGLDLAAPPPPLSSPPTLTPTEVHTDVPALRRDVMDELEPRAEMDLSAVLEEAFQDLSQPSSEGLHPAVRDESSPDQSCEVDLVRAGIYSEVFQETERVPVAGRPKWTVSPKLATTAVGDYAVPADSLGHKRESFDAPEGYVAYATVDRKTKRTHHVTVKTLDRDSSLPAEPVGGDRPVSTLSEESPYAIVRPTDVEQVASLRGKHASIQAGSGGAPVMDSTKSNKDKLGVSLEID